MPHVVFQSFRATDTVTETFAFGSGTGADVPATSRPTYDLTNGTGAGQIDYHYEHTFTLGAAATTTLILSALTDDITRTVAFVKIKRLEIRITSKTGNDALVVGAAAANPVTSFTGGTTPTWTVRTYDLKLAMDANGFAVAAGTSDQLRFTNTGSASMTFIVSISGTSA